MYFTCPLELEAKLPAVQVFNNPINTFFVNPKILLYCVFSLNIYEHPKHHQRQYYHNQLKNLA